MSAARAESCYAMSQCDQAPTIPRSLMGMPRVNETSVLTVRGDENEYYGTRQWQRMLPKRRIFSYSATDRESHLAWARQVYITFGARETSTNLLGGDYYAPTRVPFSNNDGAAKTTVSRHQGGFRPSPRRTTYIFKFLYPCKTRLHFRGCRTITAQQEDDKCK